MESDVAGFYEGAHVLVTGGTGLLGRVLIDKLLRSCPAISRVYLILRVKKEKDPIQRMDQLFKEPLFELLRKAQPDFYTKLELIPGDCSEPGLGISNEHRQLLTDNLTHVFHCAATVRFDEPLLKAFTINIKGVQEILLLCKQCINLKAVVHVSTAFSNCPHPQIDEKLYKPGITAERALKLLDCLDEEQLNAITPRLIAPWPNTYTFSKCIAEDLVASFADLPIAIVRPSIVVGCAREPIPGWIDTAYGPTGVTAAINLGLLRVFPGNTECKADMIPVDMTVNALICAAWRAGSNRDDRIGGQRGQADNKPTPERTNPQPVPIYNYVMSERNGLRWGEYLQIIRQYIFILATVNAIWFPTIQFIKYHTYYKIKRFFIHIIPAFIFDSVMYLIGKNPSLMKRYAYIHKANEAIEYFTTHEWSFGRSNTKKLWAELGPSDQHKFPFDMDHINWQDFFLKNFEQMRVVVLGDDPSTISSGRRRMIRLAILHYTVKSLFIAIPLLIIGLSIFNPTIWPGMD